MIRYNNHQPPPQGQERTGITLTQWVVILVFSGVLILLGSLRFLEGRMSSSHHQRQVLEDGFGCYSFEGPEVKTRSQITDVNEDIFCCYIAGPEVKTRSQITDVNEDNVIDFVLSSTAFRPTADINKSMDQAVSNLGIANVEYKRVHCDFRSKNFSIRVQESSKKNYLAIKFLYQGNKTEILVVEVAKVGSPNWISLKRNYGAIWRAPTRPLKFQVAVLGGYDAKWVYIKTEVPADWKVGMINDTGLQINHTGRPKMLKL